MTSPSPDGAPPADAASSPDPAPSGWSIPRIAAVMAALAIALFWLWIFSGAPAKENPDRLQDEAYVTRLEQRCQQLRQEIGSLPRPRETPIAADRAAVIEEANARIAEFIDDVAAGAPAEGDAAISMAGWIADWRTYLEDREEYAERLLSDEAARLNLSASPLGDGVDKTILIFAQVNGIPDCATPGDVG